MLKYIIYGFAILLSITNLEAASLEGTFAQFDPQGSHNFQTMFERGQIMRRKTSPIELCATNHIDVDPRDFRTEDAPPMTPEIAAFMDMSMAVKRQQAQMMGLFLSYGFEVRLRGTSEKIGYVTVNHNSNGVYIPWLKIDQEHRGHKYSAEVLQMLENFYKHENYKPKLLGKSILSFKTNARNPLSVVATQLGYQQCSNDGSTALRPIGLEGARREEIFFVKSF